MGVIENDDFLSGMTKIFQSVNKPRKFELTFKRKVDYSEIKKKKRTIRKTNKEKIESYLQNPQADSNYSLQYRFKIGEKHKNTEVSNGKCRSFVQSVNYIAKQYFFRTKVSQISKTIKKATVKDVASKRTKALKERVRRIKTNNQKKKLEKNKLKKEQEFLFNLAKGKLNKEQKDFLLSKNNMV